MENKLINLGEFVVSLCGNKVFYMELVNFSILKYFLFCVLSVAVSFPSSRHHLSNTVHWHLKIVSPLSCRNKRPAVGCNNTV